MPRLSHGLRRAAARALAELEALARDPLLEVSPYDRGQCLVFVARALLGGWGVPRDVARARNCLRRASALGSREAAALLDEMPR